MQVRSNEKAVSQVVDKALEFVSRFNVDDDKGLSLILRELVINGMVHGNKRIGDLTVSVSVRALSGERFRVTVTDRGSGFAHGDLKLELPENPKQIQNRGLCLVNSLAESLEFNETGNQAIAVVDCSEQKQP